jgi:hypothetical protein
MANINNTISGDIIGIAISTVLDTPVWKDIVCSMGTTSATFGTEGGATVVTRCGVARSAGRSSNSVAFEGLHNKTITSGSEVSANELAAIKQAGQTIRVRIQATDTPANYYREAQAVLGDYSEDSPVGDFVTFRGTFNVQGDFDLVP